MSLSTLTKEEFTLHFYAALIQRDLEAYHARISSDGTNFNWKDMFEDHLVRFYSSNLHCHLSFYCLRGDQ
jgi:hypothetical protein